MVEPIRRTPRRPRVPEELVEAVTERRVIPFIGAGFSASVGLPDWKDLLARLCREVDSDLSFDEINEFANGDFLQIAEYLFIKSDRRIGPLRHVIEQGLNSSGRSPVKSTAHVELVNLGAPQIYTTNYDDLLETTYRRLGVPYSLVSLPKDVASVNNTRTQIIKYHGDLRHESTLVLTESAYYKRLDFESPMDLKFRSDLLGRSVLYMGYSFRDINIRLIWFKLMQMMQDIPASDRRPSYILRLTPNPVLDELYRDVGLRTIVLDPEGRVEDSDRPKLLGDFLGDLAARAATNDHIPGSKDELFLSERTLSQAATYVEQLDERGVSNSALDRQLLMSAVRGEFPIRRLVRRRVPRDLESEARETFYSSLRHFWSIEPGDLTPFAAKVRRFGSHPNVTSVFARILRGGSTEYHELRQKLYDFEDRIPWDVVWGAPLGDETAKYLVESATVEVDWNEGGNADPDLVFLADLLKRFVADATPVLPKHDASHDDLKARAAALLDRIAAIYPRVTDYEPTPDEPPRLDELLHDVKQREEELASGTGTHKAASEQSSGVPWQTFMEAIDGDAHGPE